ncbi:hypothetical protein ALO91_200089 [Pseudomonas syringae pv. aceris]|uniref:SprT n=1 Tax=Pseudomonas syringae pv. aceris TaxID=199198 RepID=A0A0L8IUQ5_PSESX|nr:hypothetical protein PSYAR_26539 [Pseudomonas syringae pv. aceris str. M302273]KOG04909.1 Uncharacterized protein ABJ98_2045 [Pseudomonas syringae pv. aceris]KPW20478.1 hypothetical protein ALO91_200089 [Pseudomonas syringae pv. aceris]
MRVNRVVSEVQKVVIKYVITTFCGFSESDTVAYNSVVFVT